MGYPMRQLFKTQQHLGFAQPKLFHQTNLFLNTLVQKTLDLVRILLSWSLSHHCEKDHGQYDNIEKVTGKWCGFLGSKTAFTQLGFDERFSCILRKSICVCGESVYHVSWQCSCCTLGWWNIAYQSAQKVISIFATRCGHIRNTAFLYFL